MSGKIYKRSEETRRRMSEAKLRLYSDPEVRARHAAAMKLAMADPEVRARKSAAMADPEVRARHAAAMKRAMADPEVRARHAAAMADPEVRARLQKALGWLSADERACVIAEIKAGVPYVEISLDWLISVQRVTQIAKEEGLQRRPRHRAVAASRKDVCAVAAAAASNEP